MPLKLTFTNFSSLRAQFNALLTGFDLVGYINGSLAPPPSEIEKDASKVPNPAYGYWVRQDMLILHAILAFSSDSVVPLIAASKTSCEAWKMLTKMYASRNHSRVMDLKNTLTCAKRESKPVVEYLQHMKHIADEICIAGSTIEEDDLVLYILNGLGSEYKEIYTVQRARETSVTFDELHESLIAFELSLKQEAALARSEVSVPAANYTRRFSSTGCNSGSRFRGGTSTRSFSKNGLVTQQIALLVSFVKKFGTLPSNAIKANSFLPLNPRLTMLIPLALTRAGAWILAPLITHF